MISQRIYGVEVSLEKLIQLRYAAEGLNFSHNKNTAYSSSGLQNSRFRGRGIDFDEVRCYQPGDDIRNMDWRVTARTGKPHTKLYREERERPVYFVTDFSASMYFGTKVAFKSVIAAQVTSLLAWASSLHGDRVGGLIFSGDQHKEIRPQMGTRGILPLLRTMAEFTHKTEHKTQTVNHTLSDYLKQLRRIVKPGSLIFIISDFQQLGEDAKTHLQQLSLNNDLLACYIYDPLEANPPPANQYNVTNGDEIFYFNSNSKEFCEQYQQQFTDSFHNIQQICCQRQIPLLPITTDADVIKLLKRYFGKSKIKQ